MKIAIGNDHGGTDLKWEIKKYLEAKGYEIVNLGTDTKESCDYPVYAKKVADAVIAKEVDCGILICGTGVGISIAANKIKGIRAAVCSDTATARLVKQHNNANILAFGGRIVGVELAKDICDAYLEAEFEGNRHNRRIAMIHELENE
ncbi:MAG: ribose 5-phosphate isomerase B [Lachnospiraceae bacterium]|nr:ribose 5-phosphate isomerase B [Lachnospiraceae bacterium]